MLKVPFRLEILCFSNSASAYIQHPQRPKASAAQRNIINPSIEEEVLAHVSDRHVHTRAHTGVWV